jgi:hypothetical protein
LLADRASYGDVVRRKHQSIIQPSQPQRSRQHNPQADAARLLEQLRQTVAAECVKYVSLLLVERINEQDAAAEPLANGANL